MIHHIFNKDISFPEDGELEQAVFGMGCFWGVERLFYSLHGVTNTAVGYAGGLTAHPTYEQVCTGLTGHTEVVRICFDPKQIDLASLLHAFRTVGRRVDHLGLGFLEFLISAAVGRHGLACSVKPKSATSRRLFKDVPGIVDTGAPLYRASFRVLGFRLSGIKKSSIGTTSPPRNL